MSWLGNLLQQSIKWNAHALAYEFATFCVQYIVYSNWNAVLELTRMDWLQQLDVSTKVVALLCGLELAKSNGVTSTLSQQKESNTSSSKSTCQTTHVYFHVVIFSKKHMQNRLLYKPLLLQFYIDMDRLNPNHYPIISLCVSLQKKNKALKYHIEMLRTFIKWQ